jgi:site-specific recombinase XerD
MTSELVPVTLQFDTSILTADLAPSSLAMYERDFRAYLYYAGSPEAALLSSTLERWRTHLAKDTLLSPNTINRMLTAVRKLMEVAAKQGYISYEVAGSFEKVEHVKIKALKTRLKPHARTRITPEDMRLLVAMPDPNTLIGKRDLAMLHTLASSGLRVAELASLTKGQIASQGSGYLLRVMGKNETEYEDAYLSVTAYEAIQNWLEARPVESEYIFTGFMGRGDSRARVEPMTEAGVWQTIKKYADLAGLENVKPHDLRRFLGTQLAKQDIRKAQKALRHKRIETTARHYVLDELEVGLTDQLY